MSGDKEMDEWDALQAQIEGEAEGREGRKPSPADLKRAADEFLKQHKGDAPAGDDPDAAYPESVMEDGEVLDGAARIQELEAEIAALKDQALRVRAEADNIRKRSEREVQNAKAYGVEKFAGDVLSVYDNLSRALPFPPLSPLIPPPPPSPRHHHRIDRNRAHHSLVPPSIPHLSSPS